ncbi:hypothetical protein M5689_020598 [Euphorbia peplus]|nr:hypothetical protein M5689_020598 [Euphorbia peplus]
MEQVHHLFKSIRKAYKKRSGAVRKIRWAQGKLAQAASTTPQAQLVVEQPVLAQVVELVHIEDEPVV